jgi:cell shape-determining protein MreC
MADTSANTVFTHRSANSLKETIARTNGRVVGSKMTIFGTIVAIVAAIAISIFLGPYGILVLISVTFGLVLSTHLRNKEIYTDIQRIKEKLGIEDKDDFNMSNEEIEKELEEYQINDNDTNEMTELNKQIEKELEEYIDEKDNKTKKD